MALKDLTIKGSVLTEKQVEVIVSSYIRYDVKEKQIVFLPASNSLPNKQRVLVYLVALQGWPFLTSEPVPTDAAPASIEKAVHINGGTLRPILKELKDGHIISVTGKLYRVHSVALLQIMSILKGETKIESRKRTKNKGNEKQNKTPKDKQLKKKGGRNQRDLSGVFNKFISEGFFNQPKMLRDVKDRFAEKGLSVPLSSIPKMLLKATKDEKLTRKKKDINKKKVWVYERKK